MSENYYDILGISKNATKEEIKKQYKKLALIYHPDKNRDNEEATNKFKAIAEAYATLSDDEKKRSYDMFGASDQQYAEDPFSMFNNIFNDHLSSFMNMGYEKNININDILNNLKGFSNSNINIPDIPNVHVKFHTFTTEKNNTSNINNTIHPNHLNHPNDKNQSNHKQEKIIVEKPKTIVMDINVSLEDIFKKEKKEILLDRYRNKNGKLKLSSKKIEIYIFDKEIYLEKNGNENEGSSERGDIIININNSANASFKRINDYDILYFKEINFKEIYNNTSFKLTLPNNETIKIINDNFRDNKNLLQKIIDKGIPYLNDNNEWVYGDLYIQYNVIFPDLDDLYDIVNEIYEEEIDEDIDEKNHEEIKNNNNKKYTKSIKCDINELFENY
tara:strand:+ start:219 stop:1382 length:1164 start_codon:yes stop_codon:yes gene_type:complete